MSCRSLPGSADRNINHVIATRNATSRSLHCSAIQTNAVKSAASGRGRRCLHRGADRNFLEDIKQPTSKDRSLHGSADRNEQDKDLDTRNACRSPMEGRIDTPWTTWRRALPTVAPFVGGRMKLMDAGDRVVEVSRSLHGERGSKRPYPGPSHRLSRYRSFTGARIET
jgi:hypothetical protein